MILLYSLTLKVYLFAIFICSFYNKKAKLWIKGRNGWVNYLTKMRRPGENWIWFHCASLGEYEDCYEVFQHIRKDNGNKKILLTFFSPSGYEVLKNNKAFDLVLYLPLDSRKNAFTFLELLKPESIFFSKSELWLHYIIEAKRRNIPLFLLSIRLNYQSNFLKWPFKWIYEKCFYGFNHLYCQDEVTKTILFKEFGLQNTSVTGNTRFDRVHKESQKNINLINIAEFIENSFVVIVGSALKFDENNILKIYKDLKNYGIKFIIVPHEINSEQIDSIINKNPMDIIKYSTIANLKKSHCVLYFDSVGYLKYLYKFVNFAIIGGGFNRIGIHNIIEPSVYGVCTTFGPNHRNYTEAIYLIENGCASIHNDQSELREIIINQFKSSSNISNKNKIDDFIKDNIGGSLKIIESLRKEFPGLI